MLIRWQEQCRSGYGLMLCAALVVGATGTALAQGVPEIVWDESGHTQSVEAVAYSPDGSLVASGADYTDSTVRLWRAADGEFVDAFEGHREGVRSVAFSADGQYMAVGFIVTGYPPFGSVNVWDLEDHTVAQTFAGCNVAFSPDGSILASGGGGVDRYVRMSRVADGASVASANTGSYVMDVAYSPTGSYVATAGFNHLVKIWNATTGALVRTLTGHTDSVSTVAFSPDGELLASGAGGFDEPNDATIKIWRVSDGALLRTLSGHTEWVHSVAFAPDGRHLISTGRGGESGTVLLWRVSDGAFIRGYEPPLAGVLAATYSPAGPYFAFGQSNGVVAVAENPFPPVPGDLTGDGEVDLLDWLVFEDCLAGPAVAAGAECNPADLNDDGAVDLRDAADLQVSFGVG